MQADSREFLNLLVPVMSQQVSDSYFLCREPDLGLLPGVKNIIRNLKYLPD